MEKITKNIELTRRDKFIGLAMAFAAFAVMAAAALIEIEFIAKADFSDFSLRKAGTILVLLALILFSVLSIYLYCFFALRETLKVKKLFAVTLTSFALCWIISVSLHNVSVYAMPLALGGVLAANLVDRKLGFFINVVNVLTAVAYLLVIDKAQGGAPIDTPMTKGLASLIFGAVVVSFSGRNTARLRFIAYMFLCGAAVLPVSALLILLSGAKDEIVGSLSYVALGAGLSLLLPLLFLPVFEFAFNLVSNFRLAEICDFNRPLLKKLQAEAPGTFMHCQTVSNLTESCAQALGENVYFARAAALYHDIGKLAEPGFYIENLAGKPNPHDGLTPELSAEIIHRHPSKGYEMILAARLPKELALVAREHHGTTPLMSFYGKAQKLTDGEVDIKAYRYKEPLPSTKTAALVMICDSCEAAIRSMAAPTLEKIDGLISAIIDERNKWGQFDNTELSMKDFAIIKQTILNAALGLYHSRIEYPKEDK